MPPIGLGASLGIGGGRSATSSGAPSGGGGTPFANTKSVTFDGVDDHASFTPGWIATTADYTLSMWLNVNSFSSFGFAFCTSQGNTLTLNTNGNVRFETRTYISYGLGSKTVITGASVDTWYHLAVVKQANVPSGSTTFTYYVNGSSVGTYVYGAVAATYAFGNQYGTSGNVYLARYNSASYYGNALIDELAIFTSALDATAVSGIYNGGTPADLSSLSPRNWYRMGDGDEAGSGTTVYDMGSAGGGTTDMTLVNAVYSTDVP